MFVRVPSPRVAASGSTLTETNHAAMLLERLFTLLPDTPAIHMQWRQLVVTYGVQGVQVHDARLVAGMLVHSLTHILTLNPSDFSRYPGITAVHPSAI